jgi:hypothetical protein
MKKALCVAVAVFLALCASAQDSGAERIMVSLAAEGIAGGAALRDSLEAALAASPFADAVLRYAGGGDDLVASAAKSSCPIALSVSGSATGEGIRIEWRYVSSTGGLELRAGSFEKSSPGPRDLVSSFWTDLVQDLGPAIKALPRETVIVAAPPGVRVEGFGGTFSMPPAGQVEVEMSLPAVVPWKAGSRDYLDASGRAYIEAPLTRIELPMIRPPAWTAELSLYSLSFPEARAAYLIGKRLFVRVTITQFLGGLDFQNNDGEYPEPSSFSSFSLLQTGGGIGTYFEDPDRNLRFYAAMDAFLRLDMPGYQAFFVDPIAPVGIFPLVGAEWGRGTGTKLYFELGGIFYPYAIVDLMLASRGSNGGDAVVSGPGWFPGHPGWLAEFPVPRLGLRIYL